MNKTNQVDKFIEKWDLPLKAEVEAVRSIILSTDEQINESIKWNAPSFFIKDHFATVKPRPVETVQVVFHTGAKVKDKMMPIEIDDPTKLLEWVSKNRCVATFSDMEDLRSKKIALVEVVRQWINQV